MNLWISIALYVSFIMSIFLISQAYFESLRLMNSEGKVKGIPFVFLSSFSLVFTLLTSYFYQLLY
ncbi:hypothetical protein CHN50_09175 [Priestia aryabhattai]|nr:hypothetical protein CHN50_09175 [Priestia aryabhattai]TDB51704.1 hypothetical protein EPL02_08100 [Bacillus sp. CBEL-1]